MRIWWTSSAPWLGREGEVDGHRQPFAMTVRARANSPSVVA
jgi:hypothetical protein